MQLVLNTFAQRPRFLFIFSPKRRRHRQPQNWQAMSRQCVRTPRSPSMLLIHLFRILSFSLSCLTRFLNNKIQEIFFGVGLCVGKPEKPTLILGWLDVLGYSWSGMWKMQVHSVWLAMTFTQSQAT